MQRLCRALVFFVGLGAGGLAFAAPALLVFGDSLSAAYGIAQRRGWVALLEERLKRERLDFRLVNASISGETTAGGRARLARLLEQEKPAILILELGANDGLRGLPVAEMRKNLSAMIEQSKKAGAKVLVVGLRLPPNYGPDYTKSFQDAFAHVAKEHRTAFLPSLLEGFEDKPEFFQSDRIHPTENAQAAILDNVWKALQPLVKERSSVR
ncbi:MAG TPA: arylesterase [Burkholderiales bacterium]|nr:arylesterase [Burkholderiales bacterium]